jgi:hypothetical protein
MERKKIIFGENNLLASSPQKLGITGYFLNDVLKGRGGGEKVFLFL